MVELKFDESLLRPLIKSVVIEVIEEMQRMKQGYEDRLIYSEVEAAAKLGLNYNQLRDLRYEGKISYSRIVGNRIAYTIKDLLDYLSRGRVEYQE